jgi:hypothetical protein
MDMDIHIDREMMEEGERISEREKKRTIWGLERLTQLSIFGLRTTYFFLLLHNIYFSLDNKTLCHLIFFLNMAQPNHWL